MENYAFGKKFMGNSRCKNKNGHNSYTLLRECTAMNKNDKKQQKQTHKKMS